MKPATFLLAALAGLTAAAPVPARAGLVLDPAAELTRIGFGSCNSQDKPQLVWDALAALRPQCFLFLGDNIYGDSEDMEVLKAKWNKLGSHPGYRKIKAMAPILATWDDHDYGANDGGAEYPQRDASQKVFLDFFEEPADSERRSRPGVYGAWTAGPAGRRVQIILLDTRYFRTPHIEAKPGERKRVGSHLMNEDPSATVLGEAQWSWLEKRLAEPADFRIIGSSIQFLADYHGIEAWAVYPREKERLTEMLAKAAGGPAVVLSGDVHWAEIMEAELPGGRRLVEVTSSGMTHVHGAALPSSKRMGKAFPKVNFGFIDIDWKASPPKALLRVLDRDGNVQLERALELK